MTNAQRGYLAIFLLFAIAYVGAVPLQPYPGDFVIKAIPAITISLLALQAVARIQGKLLFVAFLFCAAGDASLGFEKGENLTIGLGFFLIAQVLFVVTFTRDFRWKKSRLPIVVLLVSYAIAMALILAPSLEDMALPVYVYLTVITFMGISAALRHSKSNLVLYGALFFIASDSMLAVEEFLGYVPASDYLIMVTYYLALFLIVWGFVRHVGDAPQQSRVELRMRN